MKQQKFYRNQYFICKYIFIYCTFKYLCNGNHTIKLRNLIYSEPEGMEG